MNYEYDKRYALELLGQGLHPLQDIYAHGNITNASIQHTSRHDKKEYNWVDTTVRIEVVDSGQKYGQRYYDTEEATKNYLNDFISQIGGSLKYKYDNLLGY